MFNIKRSAHIYIKLKKLVKRIFSGEALSQTEVDIFCVLFNIINIIIDYYVIITYLPQANFGPLTRGQPQLPNSGLMCYPTVSLSLFYILNSGSKEKMARENLEISPNSILHWFIWRKLRGCFNREDSSKKRRKV